MPLPVIDPTYTTAEVASGFISVPYPSGIASGDILIIFISSFDSNIFNTPSGWVEGGQDDNIDLGGTGAWFWKRATGAESGSVEISDNAANNDAKVGAMIKVSDVRSTGNPYDNNVVWKSPTYQTPFTASELTTLTNNALRICFLAIGDNRSSVSPTGFTEVLDFDTSLGSNCALSVHSQPCLSAGVQSEVDDGAISYQEYILTFTFDLCSLDSISGWPNKIQSVSPSKIQSENITSIEKIIGT